MVRLLSLISVLSGVGLAAYGIYSGRDLGGLAALCSVFVGSAFAAKVTQKFVEIKGDK
jgi:hypothetical protein